MKFECWRKDNANDRWISMNVFELFAKLGLDSSEYDEGLDNAESRGSKFGEGLKKAAGVTAGAIAATTAATIAGAKAFVDGAADVAAYGDNIDKIRTSIFKYKEYRNIKRISNLSTSRTTFK